MIAIISSRHDETARRLVSAWAADGAALLSAEDLVSPGWVIRSGNAFGSTAVIDGNRVPVSRLSGVLTLRPSVLAEELHSIHEQDRTFVAAEINAMLVSWLTTLPCRVLNRPTATSLSGPGWSVFHWQAAAARCGLLTAEDTSVPTQKLVICDGQVRGARTSTLKAKALALAETAGVKLMELRLAAGRFVYASARPDFSSPQVRAMVRRALLAGGKG